MHIGSASISGFSPLFEKVFCVGGENLVVYCDEWYRKNTASLYDLHHSFVVISQE